MTVTFSSLVARESVETVSHALLECSVSQQVWLLSRLWHVVERRLEFPFADFLRLVAAVTSSDELAFILLVCLKDLV